MRFARALLPLLAFLAVAVLAPPALAQDDDDHDDYQEPEQLQLRGVASAGVSGSFQDTSLPGAGSLDDGQGTELMAGFQAGRYMVFLLGWQWQHDSDYDLHYFPFSVRMMSPPILERVRLYGQGGIGLLFSQLHNELNDADGGNLRASAVRAGGGVEVGFTDNISGIAYANYLWGLGSADDYEYASVGLALQYRWSF